MFQSLLRVLTAPLHEVRFRDSFAADVWLEEQNGQTHEVIRNKALELADSARLLIGLTYGPVEAMLLRVVVDDLVIG